MGSVSAAAKPDVWYPTHEPFPSAERGWGSPGVFVQVFESEDATGKPDKKVLVEFKARKADIVTFNPSPCTSVLFQLIRTFQVRGRCMSHDSVTQLENTPFIRTLLNSALIQSQSWEKDKTSPKQPWALKREPAVQPTVSSAQDFPDVLYLSTDLGDTPCLDSKGREGNQWDLELITARQEK